jgi:hypothetical protein
VEKRCQTSRVTLRILYAQPIRGPGTKQEISTSGGAQVRWRDGRELLYVAFDDRLRSAPVFWRRKHRRTRGGGATIPHAIGDPVEFDRHQHSVSTDDQRFLMNTVSEEATISPITVILNYKGRE